MANNTKIGRIFELLQKAEDAGMKESELFNDFEKSGSIRITKHRLCKMLGDSNAVVIKNGLWFLAEDHWEMTKSEFKDIMNRYELNEITTRNNITSLSICFMFCILLIVCAVASYEVGRPDTIQACADIFSYEDITIIDDTYEYEESDT